MLGNKCRSLPTFLLCLSLARTNALESKESIHNTSFKESSFSPSFRQRKASSLVEDFFDTKKVKADKKNDGVDGLTASLISGINTQLEGEFTKPLFIAPSVGPSSLPSLSPSFTPSQVPSISLSPSSIPTEVPTRSVSPSMGPTVEPTIAASEFPSLSPSLSLLPTEIITAVPSNPQLTTASLEKTNAERKKGSNVKKIIFPVLAVVVVAGAFLCLFDFEKRDDEFYAEDDEEHDASYAQRNFVPNVSSTTSNLPIGNPAYENELEDIEEEPEFEVVDFTESGSAMGESNSSPISAPKLKFLRVDENISKKGVEIYADTIAF